MTGNKTKDRRNQILEILERDGRVVVSQLSKQFGTTSVTIRSDLTYLEKEGYLIRMQGGAVPSGKSLAKSQEKEFRDIKNLKEKKIIAEKVAAVIKDRDRIFINSGTTSVIVAEALKKKNYLNVVTNSVEVAQILGEVPSFKVVLLGGELNAAYQFTSGADAINQLSQYHALWAILSVDGIDPTNGITTYHAEDAILTRTMVEHAAAVIIAADNTKIGHKGFSRIWGIDKKMRLACDDQYDKSVMKGLEELGLEQI